MKTTAIETITESLATFMPFKVQKIGSERSDAMEYTRRINVIRNCVEESVLHDFVYA